jgi:hypothetical protein
MMVKPNMPEKNPLDSLILAYPCPIQWDSMDGDERERFCEKCSMKVFNISDLPKSEAETFLRENSKSENLCVKFYLRKDGTIKTNNCPKILRPIYRRIEWLRTGLSFAAMSIMAFLTGCAKPEPPRPDVIGRPNLALSEKIFNNVLNVKSGTAEEAKLLLGLKSNSHNSRLIDTESLNDLKNYYSTNHKEAQRFRVRLLQVLLASKERAKECLVDSMLLQLEEERQQILARLLAKAETQVEKKNYSEAWKSLSEYFELAACDLVYIDTKTVLPQGVKQWTLVGAYHEHSTVVLSEASVLKVITLLQKLEPKIYSAMLLNTQLRAAIQIERDQTAKNEEALVETIEKTRLIAEREELMKSDVIALATHEELKKVSTTEYLNVYTITEFLKHPPNASPPKRYVEDVLNYLTMESPPPSLVKPAVSAKTKEKYQCLIFLTDSERSGDDLRHKKDYMLKEKPSEDEIKALRDALEKKDSYARND